MKRNQSWLISLSGPEVSTRGYDRLKNHQLDRLCPIRTKFVLVDRNGDHFDRNFADYPNLFFDFGILHDFLL